MNFSCFSDSAGFIGSTFDEVAACALVTCEVTICYGLVYEESVGEVTVRDVLVPGETIDKEADCDVLDHLANVDRKGLYHWIVCTTVGTLRRASRMQRVRGRVRTGGM